MTEPRAPRESWHEQQERGSVLGMRIVVWVYRVLGRPLARLILVPIATYFFVFGRRERAASLGYLRRLYASPGGAAALGHEPGLRDVYRHIFEFATMILDRFGFWLGRPDDFSIEVHGWDELDRVAGEGRGAVFLGSHLGNFDSMRLLAYHRSPIPVHVLMYIENAERINRVLRQLAAREGEEAIPAQIIQITPGSFEHVLEVRQKIRRGEVVAILADRLHPNEADRSVDVDFLGGRAPLPEGPFLLAGALGCPVLMMTSIRTGDARYDVHVERLADRLPVPRSRRQEAVAEHAQDYADRLSRYLLLAPHQWFNFYDFWKE